MATLSLLALPALMPSVGLGASTPRAPVSVAVRTPPPYLIVDASIGGGRRGGGGVGEGSGRPWDGDGEGEEVDVPTMAAKHGLDVESLPVDLVAALKDGRVGAKELANWGKVLSSPLARVLALSSFVRARLLSDPRLVTVLGIEIALGAVMTLAAEKAARGDNFMKEIDFVLANQLLITLTNIALVMTLTPAAAIKPPSSSKMSAYLAQLPGYILQKGDFSKTQRAMCFISKATMFSCLGAMTSATGQYLTQGIIRVRSKLDPEYSVDVALAPVLPTSAAYSVFMAASSNTRYQIVHSVEAIFLPRLPVTARTAISAAVRTGNNFVGSSNWIWWAKQCGLQ